MQNNNTILDDILQDENLTKEQKLQAVSAYFANERKNIDKELRDYLLKQSIGLLLEFGSAFVPLGRVGKVGGIVGKNLLKQQLGRRISENIGEGFLTGGISGGVFGAGEGLTNDTNPLVSSLAGTVGGAAAGGALGGLGANVERAVRGQQLKNYGNIDELDKILRKQYGSDVRSFYQDYIQEIQLNKNGPLGFSKRGVQEQLRWNPQGAQDFPELINDIKRSKYLDKEPNFKPAQKPDVSHYEVYRGKNGDHYIEVSDRGKRRFYITKETPDGSDQTTSLGAIGSYGTPEVGVLTASQGHNGSSNVIINDVAADFNPGHVASFLVAAGLAGAAPTLLKGHVEENVWDDSSPYNVITPDEIARMSNDEFSQNESLIMHLLKEGLIQNPQPQMNYSGYTNPVNGSAQIFSREDIDAMTLDEFSEFEKAIMAQLNSIGIPKNSELEAASTSGGGTVYVRPYTRNDGTEVRGYYRSK